MRKIILSMQVTLDGFIEGENGDMSWMVKDEDEQWNALFEMLENVDLLLLGRGMYSDYKSYWKKALADPKSFSTNEVKYARLAEKTKHLVFSNTMTDAGWDNTEIVNGNPAEEVAKIKVQTGKDIQIVGGARLAATLIEAGLVDEYRLIVNPAIIGKGKSFFRDQHSRDALKLVNAKVVSPGVVIMRYVKR